MLYISTFPNLPIEPPDYPEYCCPICGEELGADAKIYTHNGVAVFCDMCKEFEYAQCYYEGARYGKV